MEWNRCQREDTSLQANTRTLQIEWTEHWSLKPRPSIGNAIHIVGLH